MTDRTAASDWHVQGQAIDTGGRTEGARELILAIFRLAVADYLGISYDHDEPVRDRRVRPVHQADAAAFLVSPAAAGLADLIGLSAAAIWREAWRRSYGEIPARSLDGAGGMSFHRRRSAA